MIFCATAFLMFFFAFGGIYSQTTNEPAEDNDQIVDDGTPQVDGDSDEMDERELEELDPWFLDADPESDSPDREKIKDSDTDKEKDIDEDKNTDKEIDSDRDKLEESLPDNRK